MATNSVLAKLAVNISANTAQFNQSLAKTQNNLKAFTSGVTRAAGALGLAFGAQQVAGFLVELSKLGGVADGVQAAFNKLPNSVELLNRLKDATGGTVSELELMRRSVQASNFDISLEALPRLLEFAAVRAQQTGESVDYLVNSIVTGIGRKSPLILDNLGISSIELKKRLGDVSIAAADVGTVAKVVGDIAEESLSKTGGLAETAAVKMERLTATWENLKVAIGRNINEGGVGSAGIDLLIKGLDNLNAFLVESNMKQIRALSQGITQFGTSASFAGMSAEQVLQSLNALKEGRHRAAMKGDIALWGLLNDVLHKGLKELDRLTQTNDDKVTPIIDEQADSLRDLVAEWDRANSIFRKPFKASDQIKTKTGADFLFDSGALLEMSNAGANALRTLDQALKVNSNAWDVWWSGVQVRTEKAQEAFEAHQQKTMRLAEQAETLGSALGGVFSTMATGQEDLLQVMLRATEQIISMFLQQSIAAMIAAAIKDPSTPFPFAKIAIAAAGIAAVKGLFGAIGGAHGGGGVSSAPGRLPSETVRSETRIRGYDLHIIGTKDGYRRSRVG